MSLSGKQTPLGINVMGAVLQNTGFTINPTAQGFMGASKTNTDYTPGSIVNTTVLKPLTYAIHAGYNNSSMSATTYNNLISIGATTIPALGNAKASTYVISDPSNHWTGVANTGYYIAGNVGQGQQATWIPYDKSNPNASVTQWGYIRLFALQAWNEFNWNGIPDGVGMPVYTDFLSSVMTVKGYTDYNNTVAVAASKAPAFLQGTFSNMNDLITADLAGVTLAMPAFGQDCITAGKVIDLTKIARFGLPSVLLQTIKSYNVLTTSLALALLASGLTNQEINAISRSGAGASITQEQKLYGAFLVIVGQDLLDIMIPLNCKTKGLDSLADLLNIKKLFPNSYQSLTVPLYNLSPSPNNSKTYLPIFIGTGVNSAINTPAVQAQVGTIIPPGQPIVTDATQPNIQLLSMGYGSYLDNILPPDVAVSSGAFSYSMRQVKNIQQVEFEKFAQVVASLETLKGLDQLANIPKPVNNALASATTSMVALGSGPDGTFTASDFFGCMSGLPYLWETIQSGIKSLQTSTLDSIYYQLVLGAAWKQATGTVTYSTSSTQNPPSSGLYDWSYTVTGVTLTDGGGGYSRGGAPTPSVTITGTSGATASATIDSNSSNVATTYGKVTALSLGSAGTAVVYATGQGSPTPGAVPVPPALEIQAPPTSYGGGSNTPYGTAGFPTMDTVLQTYIDQANAEILAIQTAHPDQASSLNLAYDMTGTQLTIEQRARFIAIPAVPSPNRDDALNASPTAQSTFVDAIPGFGLITQPHMYAQTIEAISDLSIIGGQSVVGMMRQSRNQARLDSIGIPLDDDIPGQLDPKTTAILIANGTIAGGPINGFTPPSTAPVIPAGYYNTIADAYYSAPVAPAQPLSDILAADGCACCTCAGESVKATVVQATETGTKVDIGQGYPGSLAGSPYTNLIPPNLNGNYISATVLPSTYTVPEAIVKVQNQGIVTDNASWTS